MQNDNVVPGAPMFKPEAREAIAPIQRALKFARANKMRVIYAAHAHRSDGSDMGRFAQLYPAILEGRSLIEGTPGAAICDELRPETGEIVIVKRRHSAFVGTDLDIVLRSSSIDTVFIVGYAVASCVLSTARDAIAGDYRTIVLGDACAAGSVTDLGWGSAAGGDVKQTGLAVMAGNTAQVWTVNEFTERVST